LHALDEGREIEVPPVKARRDTIGKIREGIANVAAVFVINDFVAWSIPLTTSLPISLPFTVAMADEISLRISLLYPVTIISSMRLDSGASRISISLLPCTGTASRSKPT
jgi:hypothetical protein